MYVHKCMSGFPVSIFAAKAQMVAVRGAREDFHCSKELEGLSSPFHPYRCVECSMDPCSSGFVQVLHREPVRVLSVSSAPGQLGCE